MMEKVFVNGPQTHPVFDFLKYNSPLYDEAKGVNGNIGWNFSKFLIDDSNGGVSKYYKGPHTGTQDISADVQSLLAGKGGALPRAPTGGA